MARLPMWVVVIFVVLVGLALVTGDATFSSRDDCRGTFIGLDGGICLR